MPAPMLTKVRQKKVPSSSVPGSHFQPALSPIQDFSKYFPRASGCPAWLSVQGGLLSSASQGHLWVCPGPPQHRMGLCHPLVAYKGWQACCGFEVATSRTPAPGKAEECLQPAPCPSIPAIPFCSQELQGDCSPLEDQLSQLSCPMSHTSR